MKSRRKSSGFTLIEALFAMAVVAMCAMIVTASMPVATVSQVKADYLNRAAGLAQKELEAIRGGGYQNANASQMLSLGLIDSVTPVQGTTYSFTNCDAANLDNPAKVLPNGTGTVTLVTTAVDLIQVTVTVNWQEKSGTKTYSVGTVLANL